MDLRTLETRATKRAVQNVRVHYSEEEMAIFKDDLSRLVILMADEDERFEPLKKEHKTIKEDITDHIAEKVKAIRLGFLDKDVECLFDPDYENGMMMIYSAETGELMLSRKLHPTERQTHMASEAAFASAK